MNLVALDSPKIERATDALEASAAMVQAQPDEFSRRGLWSISDKSDFTKLGATTFGELSEDVEPIVDRRFAFEVEFGLVISFDDPAHHVLGRIDCALGREQTQFA